MIDPQIKEQLDRIEQYSLIAAKNVLTIKEAAIILGMTVGVGIYCHVRPRNQGNPLLLQGGMQVRYMEIEPHKLNLVLNCLYIKSYDFSSIEC